MAYLVNILFTSKQNAYNLLMIKAYLDSLFTGSNMPVWSEWSAWSTCDRPCDTGSSLRFRTCLDKKNGCQGLNEEKINCGQSLCNSM